MGIIITKGYKDLGLLDRDKQEGFVWAVISTDFELNLQLYLGSGRKDAEKMAAEKTIMKWKYVFPEIEIEVK